MTDFLFATGLINNLALLIIVVGYSVVGIGFGWAWGHERAERKSYAREDEAREYWRSYYSHPANRL
jgi:hypothetical protein